MPSGPKKVPPLKKTPVAARYLRQLIEANDQVCFAALGQWEFSQALLPLIATQAADFTPTVFEKNPFAPNINRKIGDLPSFARESEQVALRMGVIAGAEFCLAFLEDAQQFRQSLATSTVDSFTDDKEEEQIRVKIAHWLGRTPATGYFRTLGFFRHLRNHYAHLNHDVGDSFQTYIRSYATPLNRFWNNGMTNLHGLNFRTLASTPLTPALAFGIMNATRICIQHVDDMIANTLELTHAIHFLAEDIRGTLKGRQLERERLATKIKARLESDWGIKVNLLVVSKEIERLGPTGS